MEIEIWGISKTKFDFLRSAEEEYLKRIKHYTKASCHYFAPVKNANRLNPQSLKLEEAKMILDKISSSDHLILLDERGKQYNSLEFSKRLNNWQNRSLKKIIFLIGGAYGFDNSLYERANEKISLSTMTFSHQLIRTIFLEQLYRAYSIINNHAYHNE